MNNSADIQTVDVTSVDHESIQMESYAKETAEILSTSYPNHVWMVGWAPGGVLIVKNMAIDDGRYGFTIDAARSFSSSDLKRQAILAGGELLERCGVSRGAWNGEMMALQDKTEDR